MFSKMLIVSLLIVVFMCSSAVIAESSNQSADERLAKAVIDQKIVLDDISKNNIVAKCVAAQNNLKNIQNNTDMLVRTRVDIYSSIQRDLQTIKIRMIRQGSDASETDLLTGKIQQELDKFTIQSTNYGSALDDVIGINCQQKPEAFKAGLVIMRTQRNKLLEITNNLKYLVNNSDDTTFIPLNKRLTI